MVSLLLNLRRSLIASFALSLIAVHGLALAQATKFPDKPVKLIVTPTRRQL